MSGTNWQLCTQPQGTRAHTAQQRLCINWYKELDTFFFVYFARVCAQLSHLRSA